MLAVGRILTACLVLGFLTTAFAADIILNEYNAVDNAEFLNGGNASADEDGGRASDSYFGRLQGNGGDWFEMVVITDHLDMRNWKLEIYQGGSLDETLYLTADSIWSDLRSGTIITLSEDVESDISYNPSAGDWWINVQANDGADAQYIEASNFPVSSNNWQLRIKNNVDAVVFGPAGEGVSPTSGIGPTEVFRLEADPSALITPASDDYDDGKTLSTFGEANRWGQQDLNQLRSVVAQPSTVTLLGPNGWETIMGATVHPVTWQTTGTVDTVLIEFSIDDGERWFEVYPPNAGNTGSYNWLVPIVDSQQCRVRIVNAADLAVYDMSNQLFSIYECPVKGELTGDCDITMHDFAVMAAYWLECGHPSCLF